MMHVSVYAVEQCHVYVVEINVKYTYYSVLRCESTLDPRLERGEDSIDVIVMIKYFVDGKYCCRARRTFRLNNTIVVGATVK